MNLALRVLGLILVLSPLAHGTTLDQVELSNEQYIADGGTMAIAVISLGGTYGSYIAGSYALDKLRIAQVRTKSDSHVVVDSSRANMRPTYGAPLAAEVLRGTIPGDVVRLEYVASSPGALKQAVADLSVSKETWENRFAQLSQSKSSLDFEVTEARRVFTQIPLDEAAKQMRGVAFENFEMMKREERGFKMILADAEARMHSARFQYQAARLNLAATEKSGRLNQQFHIVREVLVDANSERDLKAFFSKTVAWNKNGVPTKNLPSIRISRVLHPNTSVAANAWRGFKGGILMATLGVAVVVEELTVGLISESMNERAQNHNGPRARTQPADSTNTGGY